MEATQGGSDTQDSQARDGGPRREDSGKKKMVTSYCVRYVYIYVSAPVELEVQKFCVVLCDAPARSRLRTSEDV